MCQTCSICLDNLNQQKGNYLKLKCKHDFHFSCIFQLIATNTDYNNNCPMCRKPIIYIDTDIQINESGLLSELVKVTQDYYQISLLNTRLLYIIAILTGLTFGLMMCMFSIIHPEILFGFINFSGYLSGCVISGWIEIFNYLYFINNWIWGKISTYVLSFFVLGFFTALANTNVLFLLH